MIGFKTRLLFLLFLLRLCFLLFHLGFLLLALLLIALLLAPSLFIALLLGSLLLTLALVPKHWAVSLPSFTPLSVEEAVQKAHSFIDQVIDAAIGR